MARIGKGPTRTLAIFFICVGVLYGLVALAGTWKPALGLDLQGGTRITLTATGDVTPDSLDEAAGIIDQRVNGTGVSEAEVTTQGNKFIIVEIPGQSRRDLVETVKRQAQLRFRAGGRERPRRVVHAAQRPGQRVGQRVGRADARRSRPVAACCCPATRPTPTTSPSRPRPASRARATTVPPFLLRDETKTPEPTPTASATGTAEPSDTASPTAGPTDTPRRRHRCAASTTR